MGANNPNYQIISTDYTSFAVVYSCTNLLLAHLSKFLAEIKRDRPSFWCCKLPARILGIDHYNGWCEGCFGKWNEWQEFLSLHMDESCFFKYVNLNAICSQGPYRAVNFDRDLATLFCEKVFTGTIRPQTLPCVETRKWLAHTAVGIRVIYSSKIIGTF